MLNYHFLTLMYCSPVVYPASLIPQEYKWLYGLNPMTGVIEGFRSVLLSTNELPIFYLTQSTIVGFALFASGLMMFRKTEKYFVDVS